jgi:ATP-binding cassette subfamily C protein LapB
LARPKIWLLDEPTGSLDALSEARVTALLKEESDAGATLLVATHKPGILPLLERVVVVHGGCVVLDGPRNVVMDKLANRISPTLTVVAATGAKG